MHCPRCNGGVILRTRDHDELVCFKEPYACASCGLAFDSFKPVKAQMPLFEPPTRSRVVYQYRTA